jgi:hypothetical protein
MKKKRKKGRGGLPLVVMLSSEESIAPAAPAAIIASCSYSSFSIAAK